MWVRVIDVEDGVPVSDALLVRTTDRDLALRDFVSQFRADGILDAPDDLARTFPELDGVYTKMVVWD